MQTAGLGAAPRRSTCGGDGRPARRYALISWTTGWSTKIVKRGDHFKKFAYGKGQEPKGKPINKAPAIKVQ